MFHESDLFENEVERFSRQVIVPGIGIETQIKLRNTSVLVVGCGGLGCPVIMYLATCGIVKIGIVDHDKIEIHNLQRQVLFKEKDINKFKAEVAGEIIKQMNSNIDLKINIMKVNDTNVTELIRDYDIVLDCTDNIDTRYCLSDNCRVLKKHLICASVLRWEGHLYVLPYKGPCYRCLYPVKKENTSSCDESGIIGPVCGLFGSLIVLELIKFIVNDDKKEKLIYFNGFRNIYHNISLREGKCKVCTTGEIEVNTISICLDKVKQDLNVPEIEWRDLLDNFDNYTVLDVRKNIHFRMFRIKNSLNFPIDELEKNLNLLPKNKNLVVVVCKRGIMSKKAVKILQDHKIFAFSVIGGIEEYKKMKKDGNVKGKDEVSS